jgi:hypothetical protein
VSPWYARQDPDRDHDSVRVQAFALEALEQLKASSAVVSESALVLGDKTSIIVRSVLQRSQGQRLAGDALGESRRKAGLPDPRLARDQHDLAFPNPATRWRSSRK